MRVLLADDEALGPDVDLVTLGIGGNDIGFGEIIANCVARSVLLPVTAPCQAHYTRRGDELGARIEATAPKVAAVLAGIRERAALFDGRVSAGPRADGTGWRTRVVLPVPAREPAVA